MDDNLISLVTASVTAVDTLAIIGGAMYFEGKNQAIQKRNRSKKEGANPRLKGAHSHRVSPWHQSTFLFFAALFVTGLCPEKRDIMELHGQAKYFLGRMF